MDRKKTGFLKDQKEVESERLERLERLSREIKFLFGKRKRKSECKTRESDGKVSMKAIAFFKVELCTQSQALDFCISR